MSTATRPAPDYDSQPLAQHPLEGDVDWSNAHASFLSSLQSNEKADLLKCARRLILKPRDYLFRAGDDSDNVYIVGDGCVRLTQVSPTGKETILWLNFPGEIFGVAELLSGSHRQVNAAANDPSEVYSIQRGDFTRFLGAHPEVAMKAIGILSARVRSMGQVLVGFASDRVETRIARLLMRYAAISSASECDAASNENELCVNVRLTHQDIANLIGASRQTVTTTLAHLRRNGDIRAVKSHIHIARPGQLRTLIDQDAA